MGDKETGDSPVTEKTSLPVQAYYGSGMVPPPYFGSTVAPGQAPHAYMWGPQSMILPFGSPYTAVYPHGVYPHPAIHLMGTSPSMEMPAKSLSIRDKLPTKRHKGTNGLSTSNGIGNSQSSIGTDSNGLSQSGYYSAEGSSHGSSGNNTTEDPKSPRVQCSEDIPSTPENGMIGLQANPVHAGEALSKVSVGLTEAPAHNAGKSLGSGSSHCPTSTTQTRVSDIGKVKATGTPFPSATGVSVPARNGIPQELWMQDEREVKRERRKQSNRESARRSRLRKQAETEELAVKVDTLNAENTSLKSEINQLTKTSDKLRLENLTLTEKLKNIQSRQTLELSLEKMETERPPVVENFLSIMDNPCSIRRAEQKLKDSDDMPTGKLHLLVSNRPRTDAVTAT